MIQMRRATREQLTAAAISDKEFESWLGRISAVAHEGKRAVGLGAVLQTQDTLTYLSLAEVAVIVENATMLTALIRGCTDNQFVLMLSAGDRVTATIVTPTQPLAVLYERWGQTLEAA